MKIKERKRWW